MKISKKMIELFYVSLIPLLPLFFIFLFQIWFYFYLWYKRKTIQLDKPPEYNELVLCEKQLPKYKSKMILIHHL